MNNNSHLFLCHCPFKSLFKCVKKWLLTPRGISDSLGSHTLGRLTQRSIIPWWDWLAGVCNPCEILWKIWSHDSNPREPCFGGSFIDSLYDTPVSHAFTQPFREKFDCSIHSICWIWWHRDLLFSLNCKTYIKLTFYPKKIITFTFILFELVSV